MQRAIMTEVGQVRGWSHPDFFSPFDRVTIRPSIRHARSLKLVWQPLTRFQSLPLCLSLLGARNEHARVDRASEEFSKKIFFFFFRRVFAISICNFASNATRNEQLPWWPCLDVMSSAVGKLCKCGTNWISCRDLLGPSYLTSYIASSATRIHIRFYASSARFDSVSFSSFLLPPPSSLLVWIRATRDRCTNTRDGLSVISKLVNDVIETNRNPKNCVFVCPTLPRLITTIFTTESMHRIRENFSLTKVNIASCYTICA